jgi:hypothetical protein
VRHEDDADLVVLHVIGTEALTYREDKRVAVMQYCFVSAVDTSRGSSCGHAPR